MSAIDLSGVTLLRDVAATLKKKGPREYAGPCPFCGGEDRFSVQPDESNGGRWLCRNCTAGKWQDAANYVMRRDNVTFPEACKTLGVELPNRRDNQLQRSKADLLTVPDDPAIPEWRRKLHERGISDDTIKRYSITTSGNFWKYPSIGRNGQTIYRLKRMRGGGSKYLFAESGVGSKPEYTYYSAGHLAEAIKREHGVLWLSGGEPNTWALHSALCADDPTQAVNATFWLTGEANMPATLCDDLAKLGVKKVLFAPDRDDAGIKLAHTLRAEFNAKACDIELVVYQLPAAITPTTGYDLNDLWLECLADPAEFKRRLEALPEFDWQDQAGDTVKVSVSSDETAQDYFDLLDLNAPVEGEPLIIPFKSFHRLQGMAEVLMPGKGTGILAPSGHGKTSFLETWVDMWMSSGYYGIWHGPEWSPLEYQIRRVARYGGPSYTHMSKYQLWKREHQQGVPVEKRRGVPLQAAQIANATKILGDLNNWQGKVEYFPQNKALSPMLDDMTHTIKLWRNAGRKVGFVVFDYAQIIKADNDLMQRADKYDDIIGKIKAWAIDQHINWIVASQVRKHETAMNRTGQGLIGSDAAMFLRDDKFNLFFSLNVDYEADPRNDKRDLRTNHATANVTKNSGGRVGEIELRTDFEHLRWLEPNTPRLTAAGD